MSGQFVLDRSTLASAFTEVEAVRRTLPENTLAALAEEVVKRVAANRAVDLDDHLKPSFQDIDTLCDALLSPEDDAAISFVESLQHRGASYDLLCQSYLAEASRRLGKWWDDDKLSFYQVTLAAGRIYAILRILRLQRPEHPLDLRRHAVFAAVPGENHTLGITIAADMARDRGWDIELLVGRTHDELVDVLAQRDTALIGLSASTKRALPAVIRLIIALRISNPRAKILICGQMAALNLNLAGITGADAAAADFETALLQMDELTLP